MNKFILIFAIALLLTACSDGGVRDYVRADQLKQSRNFENALPLYIKAWEQGHPKALAQIGVTLYYMTDANSSAELLEQLDFYLCKVLNSDQSDDDKFITREIIKYTKTRCD